MSSAIDVTAMAEIEIYGYDAECSPRHSRDFTRPSPFHTLALDTVERQAGSESSQSQRKRKSLLSDMFLVELESYHKISRSCN